MPETVEQSVKRQFAKVFAPTDSALFKVMGESNLAEAARLKKKDMSAPKSLQLLARNSRKRLLIGVGIELVLKAIYLRNGYLINKPSDLRALRFPFTHKEAADVELKADQTYQLSQLIDSLRSVQHLSDENAILRGLKIAKVFRNKEGHAVTLSHAYEAANYRDIEKALTLLYRDAFDQRLEVTFSIGKEPAAWDLGLQR